MNCAMKSDNIARSHQSSRAFAIVWKVVCDTLPSTEDCSSMPWRLLVGSTNSHTRTKGTSSLRTLLK
jgi:hypothetical protein